MNVRFLCVFRHYYFPRVCPQQFQKRVAADDPAGYASGNYVADTTRRLLFLMYVCNKTASHLPTRPTRHRPFSHMLMVETHRTRPRTLEHILTPTTFSSPRPMQGSHDHLQSTEACVTNDQPLRTPVRDPVHALVGADAGL